MPPLCLLTYLWLWCRRGPNSASARLWRVLSASEGGANRVSVSTSSCSSPGVAVDKEIVGSANEGAEICCTASKDSEADTLSLFLGEEENSWVRRFVRDWEGLRSPSFSCGVMLEELEKGLESLRCIATSVGG